MEINRTVIVVAGGKGSRMNSDLPKQFMELDGWPVLMHSLMAFYDFDHDIRIILVLPEVQVGFWNELCEKRNFNVPHHVANGGDTRFASVKSGLQLVELPSLVAIHDGVRPLVSHDTIARAFGVALEHGAAVPVVDIVDSLRSVTENGSRAENRNLFKLVQTPQVFDGKLIIDAYRRGFDPSFTDDASVAEAAGIEITLTGGNRENIKITTPLDLVVAEALLKSKGE